MVPEKRKTAKKSNEGDNRNAKDDNHSVSYDPHDDMGLEDPLIVLKSGS